MQYRRFGRTELSMPVFSCGGMRYQYKWDDVPQSEVPLENQANVEATIRRSWELGITHIETARGYGSSERQLGYVLPHYPRGELIVQTKIPPHADAQEFRRQFDDSLQRLQLDHVDLLALHGINTHEHLWWATRPGGCLAVARELISEGKVRHVGFSTHGETDLIVDAVSTEAHGGFDYVNLHWYYILQRNDVALGRARKRDMGVFIISPADKGGMLYRPTDRLRELCHPLHPLVFNCLFCLLHPDVHTLSLGASCPADFDLQCSTLEFLQDSTREQTASTVAEITQRLDAALADAAGFPVDAYLRQLPVWHETPGYVNIPVILWLRWLDQAFQMREYAKMRYNLLGRGGHWFGGLPARSRGEWDWSQLLKEIPHADQIPAWLEEADRLFSGTPEKRLSES